MQVIHKWRTVDFDFPSSSNKLAMIRAGLYIPGNSLILDADFWQNGKVITTQIKENKKKTLGPTNTMATSGVKQCECL